MVFNTVILLEEPAQLLSMHLSFFSKQFSGTAEELGPSRASIGRELACSQPWYEGQGILQTKTWIIL